MKTSVNVQSKISEELQSTNKWVIKDELGNYVHQDSIRLISKEGEYTYVSYTRPERVYSYESAEIAMERLNLHNDKGNLGHSFKIETMEVPELKDYAIKDQDSRVADHYSISLTTSDSDKTLIWQYRNWKSIACGCYFYSDKELAENVLKGLNLIKQFAGFNDLQFHIEEVNGYEVADMDSKDRTLCQYAPVGKGKKMESRKFFSEYSKQYL